MNVRYVVHPDLVGRKIRDTLVIVPVRSNSRALDCFFSLNQTAAEIWTSFRSGGTIDSVVENLVRLYEIDPTVARTDVVQAVDEMERLGLLVREKESS